jgi:ferredoxin
MNWLWDNDVGVNYWEVKDDFGTSLCTVLMFGSVVFKWLVIFGVSGTRLPDRVPEGAGQNIRASSMIMKRDDAVAEKPETWKGKFLSFMPVSGNYFMKDPSQAQKESFLKKKTFSAEEKICKVCYANEGNTIVNACGHGGMCGLCAKDVVKKMGKCMMCRKAIDVVFVIKILDDARVQVIEEIRP